MKPLIFLAALLFSPLQNLHAQSPDEKQCQQVIRETFEGYNRQDYKTMKKHWGPLGKLIVSQKMLRKEFQPFYSEYGKSSIDTITLSSPYEYVARLRMEKKPEARIFFKFIFSDKAQIEGFGFAYPPLIYRKGKPVNPDPDTLKANIDRLIDNKYTPEKQPFNGSVMVLDAGKPVYRRHVGYADLDAKTALNDSTLYELASCSKQFTAAAILLLAQQDKLRLDDSIQRFIPDFPYPGISIEHLLTHTSGLPYYETLLEKVWDKSKFADNYDVIEQIQQHKPKVLFQPNTSFMYSNTGYVILSVIIEKASGMTYADFLKTRIFQPLGMKHTRVYNTRRSAQERLDNYAYGYIYSDAAQKYILPDSTKQFQVVVYQDAITGDGTVNSCLSDLALWEQELLNPTILEKKYLEKAFSDHKLSDGKSTGYGYGYFLNGIGQGERLVYHTGGWPGYVCIMMHFPDTQKAVVILSNNSYDDFTRMADDIAALLTGD